MANIKKFYVGFSTRGYEATGQLFTRYNVECVEEDLLNEIFTVKGERVNMPDYGTRIPLLVFELNDEATKQVILDDLETVFSHDPRVQLLALDVIPAEDQHALVAVAKLNYREFLVTRDLFITIHSR